MPELSSEDLRLIDAYWRASNYIGAAQIFLKANPLLQEPLTADQVKPRLLGHWGTTPGLNFIYTHLNRLIKRHDLSMMYIIGPGHGGAAILAQTYLEGSFTERHPEYTEDAAGMAKLFKEFSWPYGFSSHVDVSTPGAIHFGGELGYSLLHAFGATFDNPDLLVACIVGDGEMETGPCAASWQSNKFLNPRGDGAVLPIVHLNGYKISNPTIMARLPEAELEQYFLGLGYRPHFVEGDDPPRMHELMAATLEKVYTEIQAIQQAARGSGSKRSDGVPPWPVIVLRTPKGWTGPKFIDGKPVEDTWASHQVPIEDPQGSPARMKALEDWLRSYRPEELFDADGHLVPELRSLPPTGTHRMGMNPHANGGELLQDLNLPDWKSYAVDVTAPGHVKKSPMKVLGGLLRDTLVENQQSRNFRLFAPDELISNKLDAVLEVTTREWEEAERPTDRWLGEGGRVMEVLSEHMLEGWLEAYLLTGRHGIFTSYEAFIHIVDSMFNQHAKWLKLAREIPWRAPIASLNYLLASHVWQQDHNGFTHQDPGFLDVVVNKKPEVVRIYLPPDANCLLSVTDHCLRSRNYVNVTVAGKQETLQWLTADEAEAHCRRGASIWDWASDPGEPDVVVAGCGDVPTIEALAAIALVREHVPELKLRAVNVVDLMVLATEGSHPHALSSDDYTALFTSDKPVVFAFHGYPALIHRLASERPGALHVRGYQEEGAATTPFDMTVLNRVDRFDLALDILRFSKREGSAIDQAQQFFRQRLEEHHAYVTEYGEDMPEVQNWSWPGTRTQSDKP